MIRSARGGGGRDVAAGDRRRVRTTAQGPRPAPSDQLRARRRRERAARKHRPEDIKLLLVAEAAPAALDRYVNFEDVPQQDSLFSVRRAVHLEAEPTRANKAELLARLRDRVSSSSTSRGTPSKGNRWP